jgi:cytochrome bd ubiquinol oxidase subunit I
MGDMDDALFLHRLQFAFTVTYHYIFPQLTMGLAPLIVVLKTLGLRTNDPVYDRAARFWARIFGIAFVAGVVTGIPMEFQFGTNWARFSDITGGVIGQPLAMEGVFSFFLESAFLGLFLYGESRLTRRGHWGAAFMMFVGTWLSGFFIVATDAWMQHPVAFTRLANGKYEITGFWGILTNPWCLIQYAHTMGGALVTGAFAMAATGAFYLLSGKAQQFGRIFVRIGVVAGIIGSVAQLFPTGDLHGRAVAQFQPVTMASMEALFHTQAGAPILILGQPDVEKQRVDNPLMVGKVLSMIVYGSPTAEVKGLDAYPRDQWPTNIPLLYYSYHVMVGLGTIFIAVMALAAFLLWRGKLFETRVALWALLLSAPFPFIANTAGWMTAEVGRQPWLVYGLIRTADGSSANVSAGNSLFTLLGFMGLYALISILVIVLVHRVLDEGPEATQLNAH